MSNVMDNTTIFTNEQTTLNSMTQQDGNVEIEFWIFTGFSVPLGLGSLYLCLTQIVFCVKTANLNFFDSKMNHRNSNDAAREKYVTIINVMSAFGATCAFLRAGVDFRLTLGRYNDLGCDLSVKFKIANYGLALVSIYLVLWLRQRVFYQHPGLKHLSSKFIRFVSWAMSFVIVFGIVGTSVPFFAFGKYGGTPNGCSIPTGPLLVGRWIVTMTCTTVFQICLLALFVYPLVKHRSSMSRECSDRQDVIIPLVKRAAVTSLSCILSDIVFAFLVIGMETDTTTLATFLYDVNIVFNTSCMVMSFENWKIRLMPWRAKSQNAKAFETHQSSDDVSNFAVETRK